MEWLCCAIFKSKVKCESIQETDLNRRSSEANLSDPRKQLSSKFSEKTKFANFGPVILSIDVNGFRGVRAKLNFDYPVTALSGFNGSGKSTIGQLLLCAYKGINSEKGASRYYVASFFPVSVLDPKPFVDDASVTFHYQTDKFNSPQELTLARAKKEWSGYKRQPEKNSEYIGFTVYIPKVERRDLSIYQAKDMEVSSRTDLGGIAHYVSKILGSTYDDVYFQGVRAGKREGELGVVKRFNAQYSENNMGFGEGRVVYSVRLLESCPEKSLIVIEEPETSLHDSAQYEFSKYLIDVSLRRGHQIIFSTHSSVMMGALPPEGRKLLVRDSDGVIVYDRVSSSRIRTALSAGEGGHALICVEDNFAQSFLREILRRFDKALLSSVSIVPFGDAKAVVSAKNALCKSGHTAIAVRDGDMGEQKSENIFKFPGTQPPENIFQ